MVEYRGSAACFLSRRCSACRRFCGDPTRQEKGEAVDNKNIRKHAIDVLRSAQLLAPDTSVAVVEKIAQDLVRFLEDIAADTATNPAALGLSGTQAQVAARIRQACGLPS